MSEHQPQDQTPEDYWAVENARSIVEIPVEQLSDDEARGELIRRALAGQDVYAYTPMAQEVYVLWVRQRRPDTESRFAPMAWARLWRAGLQPEHTEGSQ